MATFDNRNFIIALEPNEVIVVGTNLRGEHIGGAARQAYKDFGAVWGQAEGLMGNTYGIPTMDLPIETIDWYIKEFVEFARETSNIIYYVTPVGTGIAGFTQEEMGEIWSKIDLPANVKLV
jgi:hypothetical protein